MYNLCEFNKIKKKITKFLTPIVKSFTSTWKIFEHEFLNFFLAKC